MKIFIIDKGEVGTIFNPFSFSLFPFYFTIRARRADFFVVLGIWQFILRHNPFSIFWNVGF